MTPPPANRAPRPEQLSSDAKPQVLGAAVSLALGLAVCSCGPSSGAKGSTVGSGVVGGQPKTVQVDPNQGGKASSLSIEEIRWGRLVDIYDAEDDDNNPATPPIRNLILREFLVSENIITDGFNYLLETSPFTEQVELTILADSDSDDPVAGLPETEAERFSRLLDDATVNLGFVTPTGLGSGYLPPFPLIPRNAAISIAFSIGHPASRGLLLLGHRHRGKVASDEQINALSLLVEQLVATLDIGLLQTERLEAERRADAEPAWQHQP